MTELLFKIISGLLMKIVGYAVKILRNRKTTSVAVLFIITKFFPQSEGLIPQHILDSVADILVFVALLFSRDVDK